MKKSSTLFYLLFFLSLSSQKTLAEEVHLKDPTKPPAYVEDVEDKEQTSKAHYELKSILIGRGRRLALINEQYVSLGDKVGTAVVIAIERNAVVLSEEGRQVKIYLFDRGIRN